MRHLFLLIAFLTACSASEPVSKDATVSENFRKYWYSGKAELSTYDLNQARYGEMRKGHATFVFVTEKHSRNTHTKPNAYGPNDVDVLKLNFTKKFITGIYPYSLMTSSFFPVQTADHSLKLSFSAQEWCGHVYTELLNQGDYEVITHSYFEGENEHKRIPESTLEDDVWSMIRLNPEKLPSGQIEMIPALSYLRLMHKDCKAYACDVSVKNKDSFKVFEVDYPELDRQLSIRFEPEFPYRIQGWTETYKSGFGEKAKKLTTTARLKKRVMLDYWNRNSVSDSVWRDSLELGY